MPYEEKRGNGPYPWRVRWPLPEKGPDGETRFGSASGFADRDSAHDYGLNMEADIRRGRYRDPRKGATPLADWAAVWMAAKKQSERTRANRGNSLRNHLLPAFGHLPLTEISWWLVSNWADRQPYARDSSRQRIRLLSQIMTGAVDAGMIEVNPLAGRRLGGTPERAPEKVWPTPEQGYLVAERLGQLNEKHRRANGVLRVGASELLGPMLRVLAFTFQYTGVRLGEAQALHRDNCGLWRRDVLPDGTAWRRRVLRVDPRIGQLIDYYDHDHRCGRKYLGPPKPPSGAREIDLPPFLADMLDHHMALWPHLHLFCAPDQSGCKQGETAWLGDHTVAAAVREAADGRLARPLTRGYRPLDAWEPVCPGLTAHGMRHGMQTWMVEDEIPEIMRCDRMGHRAAGIQGRYSHPTPAMRKKVVDALQARYEQVAGRAAQETA